MFSIACILISCKEKDELANTKLVKNPATADSVPTNKEELPVMTFDYDTYDFQEILQDEVVSHNFKFTNTGKSDLIISSARATCGCTVPEYPQEPVKPGQTGIIKVTFDSKGKQASFNKTVTITANTYPSENKIYIKGIIVKPSDK